MRAGSGGGFDPSLGLGNWTRRLLSVEAIGQYYILGPDPEGPAHGWRGSKVLNFPDIFSEEYQNIDIQVAENPGSHSCLNNSNQPNPICPKYCHQAPMMAGWVVTAPTGGCPR